MDVSSSTASSGGATQIEALKKSIDVQEKAITSVLESASEQSKEVTAQKTGMGKGIDLTA